MKPANRFYGCSPPEYGERSPLHKCTCQRLNTLKDYRDNLGKCPGCGAQYVEED